MIPTLQLGGAGRARYHAPAGGGSDPDYASVELLLLGNGTNGGTTITDSGPDNRTMTLFGNVQTSTTQVKYGSASLYFDVTTDYLTTPYNTTDFDWFSGDFTVEAWVYPTTLAAWSASSIAGLIGNADTGGTIYWAFGPQQDGTLGFYYWIGSQRFVLSSATLSANAWTHVAMTHKTGNGIQLWIGGTGNGYTAVSGSPQHSASVPLNIGNAGGSRAIEGYVDDLRVTRGVARYTATFTPPTAELPSS